MDIKNILLLLLVISFPFTSPEKNSTEEIRESFKKILIRNSDPIIFDHFVVCNDTCSEGFINYMGTEAGSSINNIIRFLFDSALFTNHIGEEEDCLLDNRTYVLLNYLVNYTSEENKEEELISDSYRINLFLDNTKFYKELCLNSECKEFYLKVFNTTANRDLNNTLFQENITNLTIFTIFNDLNERENEIKGKHKLLSAKVLLSIFLFYIILRVFFSILNTYINSSTEREEVMIQSPNSSFSETEAITNIHSKSDEDRSMFSKVEKPNKYKEMLKRLSLYENFKTLTSLKNKVYDETNLLEISLLKFITLFLISLFRNTFNLIKIFGINRTDLYLLMTSYSFILLKFAFLSMENMKVLNGIIFGYKLFSYIHDNGGINISSSDYMRFYPKCFYNLLSFMILIFLIQNFIMEYGLLIDSSVRFEYMTKIFLEDNECVREPWKIFYPFHYQYFVNTFNEKNKSCIRVFQFVTSEFYCFTFVFFLVLVFLKLQNKIVELLIFILNFIMMTLTFVISKEGLELLKTLNKGKYTIYRLYGSLDSMQTPHIFFTLYFIGFNIGIMHYYSKNISKIFTAYSKAINGQKQYMPFQYNFSIMKVVNSIKGWTRLIIVIFCIGILILVSANYTIMLNSYSHGNIDKFPITMDLYVSLSYVYENQIFGLTFAFLTMTLLLMENNILKDILNSTILTPINRISFWFFNMINLVVAYFHGFYNMEISLTIMNIVISTTPIFICTLLPSLFIVFLIEVPIRSLMKFSSHNKSKGGKFGSKYLPHSTF